MELEAVSKEREVSRPCASYFATRKIGVKDKVLGSILLENPSKMEAVAPQALLLERSNNIAKLAKICCVHVALGVMGQIPLNPSIIGFIS
jgi:hypothetical protein